MRLACPEPAHAARDQSPLAVVPLLVGHDRRWEHASPLAVEIQALHVGAIPDVGIPLDGVAIHGCGTHTCTEGGDHAALEQHGTGEEDEGKKFLLHGAWLSDAHVPKRGGNAIQESGGLRMRGLKFRHDRVERDYGNVWSGGCLLCLSNEIEQACPRRWRKIARILCHRPELLKLRLAHELNSSCHAYMCMKPVNGLVA